MKIEMRPDLAGAGVEIPAFDSVAQLVDYMDAEQLSEATLVGFVEPHYFLVDLKDGRQLYFVSCDVLTKGN